MFITLDNYNFWKIPLQGIEVHDGIVCIANPIAQLGLIDLQVIDNTNDTTTFHSQLNIRRLRIVEILCH